MSEKEQVPLIIEEVTVETNKSFSIQSQTLTVSNYLKLAAAILETIMAIPVLGGAIVIGMLYTPLFIALIVHIAALIFSKQENKSILGPIFGIITSLIAWIPFVGFVMHIIAAIFNWIGAFDRKYVK
jgi:hypothetical protein